MINEVQRFQPLAIGGYTECPKGAHGWILLDQMIGIFKNEAKYCSWCANRLLNQEMLNLKTLERHGIIDAGDRQAVGSFHSKSYYGVTLVLVIWLWLFSPCSQCWSVDALFTEHEQKPFFNGAWYTNISGKITLDSRKPNIFLSKITRSSN